VTGNPRRPNVLLVVWDCVRADHVSCNGYSRQTTPFLESLAAEGVLFEQAFASAMWTVPSHASLFTCTHECQHEARDGRALLDDRLVTLAEALAQAGYRTAGFSNNGWIGPRTGLSRGFTDFHEMFREDGHNTPGAWLKRLGRKAATQLGYRGFLDAERTNRAVQTWLDQRQDATEPFFIFVHYNEAHARCNPPPPYNHRFLSRVEARRALSVNQDPYAYLAGAAPMSAEDFALLTGLYDGAIAYLDDKVRELAELLQRRGLLDDTLLVVTADHGENLGEHGLLGHVFCVYDTLLHVPLIMRYPPAWAGGERIKTLVQSVDIFATVADLLQLDAPAVMRQLQGYSLLPGVSNYHPDFVVSERAQRSLAKPFRDYPSFDYSGLERAQRAIRTLHYKYIWASDGKCELYDIQADPGETHNIIQQHPDLAEEMRAKLFDWRGRHAASVAADDAAPDLDEDLLRRLRELGYIE